LMELDRAIRAAEENREAIDYAPHSLRSRTISCCRSATFSASSWLFDLTPFWRRE
jgi:hypothetical protein